LGLDSQDIRVNPEATDTESEAYSYVANFGNATPLVAVTHATHQKRAVAWFNKAGVQNLYPASSSYEAYGNIGFTFESLIPSISQLHKWDDLFKEKLGMLEIELK